MRLVFDIESNGLLDEMDKIWSIVIYNIDTKQTFSFDPSGIDDAVKMLQKALKSY